MDLTLRGKRKKEKGKRFLPFLFNNGSVTFPALNLRDTVLDAKSFIFDGIPLALRKAVPSCFRTSLDAVSKKHTGLLVNLFSFFPILERICKPLI
jgi:hypothetical protein